MLTGPSLLSLGPSWHHAVIVPPRHPLDAIHPLTLEAIAEFPISTYCEGFPGRSGIDRALTRGLAIDITMSALDAHVIKTYVKLELGIGLSPRCSL